MSYVPVVDISQHQGTVDFVTMRKRGVPHLILRVTHGMTLDSKVTGYYRAAIDAGYRREDIGFYSFLNPKRGNSQVTARATLAAIRSIAGRTDVLYMLDIESYRAEPPNAGTVSLIGAAWADYIRVHRDTFRAEMPGCRIIGYTNRAYWNGPDGPQDARLAAELEWLVPRYPIYSTIGYQSRGYPPAPAQWDEYAFKLASGPFPPLGASRWHGWQFSAGYNRQGPVYGCQSSDLDLNIVDDVVARKWFPTATPAPPPTVPAPAPLPPSEEDDMPKIIVDDPVLKGLFLIDGTPVSQETLPMLAAEGYKTVKQNHPWWRAAITHRNGPEAARLYAEIP